MPSCLNCFCTKRGKDLEDVYSKVQKNGGKDLEDVYSKDQKNGTSAVTLKKVPSHLFLEICKLCGSSIAIKDEVLNGDDHWHFSCFECKECGTSLVNQKYFEKEEALYCETCFQNIIPRCLTCKQKVFKGGLQLQGETDSYNWHLACMKCSRCNLRISKENLKFKENLFCSDCFADIFDPKCCLCKQPVTGDKLMYKDEAWHEICFTCDVCFKPLKDQKFVPKYGKKVCAMCNIQELI